jgi:hypothetical protein
MLYRFKSKASGDVIMVGAHGDQVLRAMGKEASPRGILTVEQQPAALQALQQAIAADDAARTQTATGDAADPPQDESQALSLRRRAWPMVDMIERALAERVDIVWGV